jgi:NIMA-interacting peptidyl-prolyl cis-trans isomerase 4
MAKTAAGKKGDESSSSASDSSKLKTANALKVRHILCEKQSKILEALAALKDGQTFSSVAEKYSEDKAKTGGSLGWLSRGSMVGAFQGNQRVTRLLSQHLLLLS